MKYRNNKIKQEHSMIKGLKRLLNKLAKLDCVKSIVPGVIARGKTTKELHLTVQYEVEGGIKTIAKGNGIQEVFILCDDVEKVKEAIKEL
jgi:hypothetical protein